MRPIKQKPICFINDCGAIIDLDELEKAIIWYSNAPTISKKRIFIYHNYPAVSIYKEKLQIHRLLMGYWMQTKIPKDFFVHHVDGNKLNCLKENLCIMYFKTHQSYHNAGKVQSEEHRRKIGEANRRRIYDFRPDIKPKKVCELIQSGMTISDVAKVYNASWSAIKRRFDKYIAIHDTKEEPSCQHS